MFDFTAFEESCQQLERWIEEADILIAETEVFLQKCRSERLGREAVA